MDVGPVAYGLGVLLLSCYKNEMPKIIERWLLFKYVEGQFTPLSKPFKTKAAAEKRLRNFQSGNGGKLRWA
jgi:hypothetical protein